MKRFIFVLIPLIFFSCNNDDADVNNPPQEDNFYALTVGNWWVYKNYIYDLMTETYNDTGVIDSISIISKQKIDGITYYEFRKKTTSLDNVSNYWNPNGEFIEFYKDSLGYLVRNDGYIKFTNSDFNERELANHDWGTVYEVLIEGETDIEVEAGSFTSIHSERYARNDAGGQYLGLDRFYYSDGVGLIYDTISYFNNPIHFVERRLDSYFVQ